MPNEKEEGDGSSFVLVHSQKVFEPLEFCRYVHGELLHVLGCTHAVACKVMNLKLCLLVSADPELGGQFFDVGEVALYEHLHERHEVRAIKCCCSFCDKPRHLSEVQDSWISTPIRLGVVSYSLKYAQAARLWKLFFSLKKRVKNYLA